MNEITLIIIICAFANYALRATPFWIKSRDMEGTYTSKVLELMPITALGALILPGIFTTYPDAPMAGIAGLAAAAIVAWFRGGLILPVTASIAAAWMALNF